LSNEELDALINQRFSGDWSEVAFSASELLAYYGAPQPPELKPEQVVCWVFAAFALSDAIRKQATSWDLHFDIFLNSFLRVRKFLHLYECIDIFLRVFQNESSYSSAIACRQNFPD
jgi:hypothetical protein